MIATICLIACVCLLIWGVIIWKGSKRRERTTQVERPVLSSSDVQVSLVSNSQTSGHSKPVTPPPLPPRRASLPERNNSVGSGRATVLGPRGLRPEQFPHCPIDKCRNKPGKMQKIFWDSKGGCYYCYRGHKFEANGRPIL